MRSFSIWTSSGSFTFSNSRVAYYSSYFNVLYLWLYSSFSLELSDELDSDSIFFPLLGGFFFLSYVMVLIFLYANSYSSNLILSYSFSSYNSSRHYVQYQESFGTFSSGGFKQNIWNPQLHLSHSNNLSSSWAVLTSQILQSIVSRCSSHFS